jgi:hypothetical protein
VSASAGAAAFDSELALGVCALLFLLFEDGLGMRPNLDLVAAPVVQLLLRCVAHGHSEAVGAQDAAVVAQEFKPRFGAEDLMNLPLREFYVKMSIDGEVLEAFSGHTLDVQRAPATDNSAKACVEHSRSKYALPLSVAQEQLVAVTAEVAALAAAAA